MSKRLDSLIETRSSNDLAAVYLFLGLIVPSNPFILRLSRDSGYNTYIAAFLRPILSAGLNVIAASIAVYVHETEAIITFIYFQNFKESADRVVKKD